MTLRAVAVALGLALATRAEAGLCSAYRAVVEESGVLSRVDVTRWTVLALKGSGIFADNSQCSVNVSVTTETRKPLSILRAG